MLTEMDMVRKGCHNFATVVNAFDLNILTTFKAVRYVHAGYSLGTLLVSVCKDFQQVSPTI